MATPRKNWSRLFDQVLRMAWPDAVIADFTRLQIFLNERWARDGLAPEEAGEATLSAQECMLVTRTQNPRSARRRLLKLPSTTHMGAFRAEEVRTGRAIGVKVRWEKFSESQEYQDRRRPNPGDSRGDAAPQVSLYETKQDKTRRKEGRGLEGVGAVLARLGIREATPAPEDLGEEQKKSLSRWVREHHPYFDSRESRRKLVDACLAHHRAKGSFARDWEAECRKWIDRQARFDGKGPASPRTS